LFKLYEQAVKTGKNPPGLHDQPACVIRLSTPTDQEHSVRMVEKDLDKHVATHMKSQEVAGMIQEGRRLQCLTLADLRAKHGEVLSEDYIKGAFGPHIEHLVRVKRSHGAFVALTAREVSCLD